MSNLPNSEMIHQPYVQVEKIHSLKFEGMTFAFEGQDPLFQNVDFEFPMNNIVWVKATSGAGRSTLLQILAGLNTPQSGKYFINGVDAVDLSFEEFLPYRLAIGYSFDYGGLLSNRTLFENLTLPLNYHKLVSPEVAKERAEYYLNYFNILKHKDTRPAMVQGGVRKLTCVIRALIHHPQVLLLDDPSIGLGQDNIYKLVDLIHQQRKEGWAEHVFVSSFDEKFMSLFDYEIVHIDDGQLHFEKVDPEKKVVHL